MRCAKPQGHLAGLPEAEPTVRAVLAVLAENRRWVRHHAEDVLADLQLSNGDCNERIRQLVGMSYPEMIAAADKADFRHTLWHIGEQIAALFEAVSHRCARLAALPAEEGPGWEEITQRWRVKVERQR